MRTLPLLLSLLSQSPFAPQSREEAWGMLIHVVFWTPQILWGIFTIFIFSRIMRSLWRGQARQWAFLLPYVMVLEVIGLQMKTCGIPPFSPTSSNHSPGYSMFWDETAPSIFVLFALLFLHAIVLARAVVERHHQRNEQP